MYSFLTLQQTLFLDLSLMYVYLSLYHNKKNLCLLVCLLVLDAILLRSLLCLMNEPSIRLNVAT